MYVQLATATVIDKKHPFGGLLKLQPFGGNAGGIPRIAVEGKTFVTASFSCPDCRPFDLDERS